MRHTTPGVPSARTRTHKHLVDLMSDLRDRRPTTTTATTKYSAEGRAVVGARCEKRRAGVEFTNHFDRPNPLAPSPSLKWVAAHMAVIAVSKHTHNLTF